MIENLRGAGDPRSSTSSSSWGDFGKEMAELGREMGRLGEELGREIAAAFQGAGWSQGSEWSKDLNKMDEQARRAQRQAEESGRNEKSRLRKPPVGLESMHRAYECA